MDGIRVEEVQQIWLVYVGIKDYYPITIIYWNGKLTSAG
jgi:hypothetical protein